MNGEKLASLQGGEVTHGLKDMIDRLNERPISKKTISAACFIRVLENAFKTRIAKNQQDAQELLQIVAERLSEEYQAGREARRRNRMVENGGAEEYIQEDTEDTDEIPMAASRQSIATRGTTDGGDEGKSGRLEEEEDGFPLEGQTETRTECQHCHFVPKVKPTSFVMLTLIVPQKSSSTLNECFDGHFKTEYIDDYKCDKCRLEHARELRRKDLDSSKISEQKESIQTDIEKLEKAMEEDPETPPKDINLPSIALAPKRKIARYAEITSFPKILIIHLSRSIFDPRSSSTKNLSKLSFPERFPVGGLLNRRNYKLLGMVTHKGTHNNGHYETFRRQHLYAPFSNPHIDKALGPYSQIATPTPTLSTSSTPRRATMSPIPQGVPSTVVVAEDSSTTASGSPSSSKTPPSTRPSSGVTDDATETAKSPTSLKAPETADSGPRSSFSTFATSKEGRSSLSASGFKRTKKPVDRWWRISDEKIKECKTSDVLSMQKEVYMLFYEMEKD